MNIRQLLIMCIDERIGYLYNEISLSRTLNKYENLNEFIKGEISNAEKLKKKIESHVPVDKSELHILKQSVTHRHKFKNLRLEIQGIKSIDNDMEEENLNTLLYIMENI